MCLPGDSTSDGQGGDRGTGLISEDIYSRSRKEDPEPSEVKKCGAGGGNGCLYLAHQVCRWGSRAKGVLVSPDAAESGELTSGGGAGLRRTVDLPPAEAHADLAGLVSRDPGVQELKENTDQRGPRTLGAQSLRGHGSQSPHLWLWLPSEGSDQVEPPQAERQCKTPRRKELEEHQGHQERRSLPLQ